MSNEQIRKHLLIQRGELKIMIKQLTFMEKATGVRKTKEIDVLLDRMNEIDRILRELEKK